MQMNAFCLDFEKPSVDRYVLQMSVFVINVLTCNLCSFYANIVILLSLDHLKSVSQTPKRISCYCSCSICSTDSS